jgi:hypothetical protein
MGFEHTDGPVLVLRTDEGTGPAIMVGLLSDPQRFSHVRVAIEAKLENVLPGPQPWQLGWVMLRSYDAKGNALWYWPHDVLRLAGTTEWRKYSAVVPVMPKIATMHLILYLGAISGEMRIRGLTITAVTETLFFKITRTVLMFMWGIASAWIVIPLLHHSGRSFVGCLALMVALALVVGALTPQPHLSNATSTAAAQIKQLLSNSGKKDAAERTAREPVSRQRDASRFGATKFGTAQAERTVLADDLAHFAVFAVLTFLCSLVLPQMPGIQLGLYLLIAAFALESLQEFSITRTAQLTDLAMNGAGIALGILAQRMWRPLNAFIQRATPGSAPPVS